MSAEHRYVLHGVSVASHLELGDLRPDAVDREPLVRIELGAVPALPAPAIALARARVHWDGHRVLLSSPGTARFAITADQIRIAPEPDADPDSVQMLLLGSVWAVCCHLRGCLLLHASAAIIGGECVAFLGNSGAGKSTLAALLAARGHRLAADDTCVLESGSTTTRLHPGPRQVKLWRDALPLLAKAASAIRPAAQQPGKFKLSLPALWLDRPRPVQRILLLDTESDDRPAGFVPLNTLDSLHALAAHTFRQRIVTLLGRQRQHFGMCAAVTATTQVHRWIRPWGMERRQQMLTMLEDWLDACASQNPPASTREVGASSAPS